MEALFSAAACFKDACYSVQTGGINRQDGIMQKQLIPGEVECCPEEDEFCNVLQNMVDLKNALLKSIRRRNRGVMRRKKFVFCLFLSLSFFLLFFGGGVGSMLSEVKYKTVIL